MIIFSDMISLFSKYWKSSDQIKKDIQEALRAFGKAKKPNYFLIPPEFLDVNFHQDTEGTEILSIETLKHGLLRYGEVGNFRIYKFLNF